MRARLIGVGSRPLPLAAATLIGVEGKKEKTDRHPQAITLLFYINLFSK
jgi:hypothetical protein